MSRIVSEGSPEPLGVTPDARGANVAVFSANATAIELCLFDETDGEIERIRLPERSGDVFHGHIEGVMAGARYGLRAHGPFAPHEGHRFNAAKLLVDPHARLLDRPFRLHPSMFGYPQGGDDLTFDPVDSAPHMPKAIVTPPAGAASHGPLSSWGETILYELHVKGFTKRHPGVPPDVQGTFAGLAHPAAIEHLAKLGVTSVEIMPAAAWIEERHLAALGLTNYWGYNPVAFAAPEPRLAPGGWEEVRRTVAALAEAGIETILDIVLNHSGEGDALGPTLSLRGLDNATYYRLQPDEPRRYIDDSGCGNTLALDRAPVVRLVMDALRTWVREAGVHGFRFDLAAAMGRRPHGFDADAPLLAAIAQDPELRGLKHIAEPWDIGPGGYQLGNFPAGWGEWNDRFRDDVRRFWRGDPGRLGSLASRLAGSADLFGRTRRPSRSINLLTAHDGFALADLVSHEEKKNEANGEQNRDGCSENWSWNTGREGATSDAAILDARRADQRALLATLLFARGTPMLSMGAELGHSQSGNNNCYAQDNELSWIDWDKAERSLLDFTEKLATLRRTLPLLRQDRVLEEEDVAWLAPDGRTMTPGDWDAPDAGSLMMIREGAGERLALLFHRGRESRRFRLPEGEWKVLIDSASDEPRPVACGEIELAPRSVVLLAGDRPVGHNRGASSETLRRLADKAGVQPVWWSIDGERHDVGEDTTRHLLGAMRLPAGSEAEARDSLELLDDLYERRPLPPVLVLREGEPLPFAHGTRLLVDSEAPTEHALARGRYTLVREDAPDAPCRLTVAPRRAWLPESVRSGARPWGVAAQLYSLRRDGDQGIGDFTTLRALGEHVSRAGAAAIGVNPLHALFGEQRERASPYSPSDRRFLDPIYLDLAALADLPGGAELEWVDDAAGALVDYSAVWALKERALRGLFARFEEWRASNPSAPLALALASFVERGGETLRTYAAFCAISRRRRGEPWQHWPAQLRDPHGEAARSFAAGEHEEIGFHAFLQWLCDRQLAAAAGGMKAAGMEIGLYRDLAIGAAPDGAEAWASQDLLASGVSIGAPPDPLGPAGQVWSLPPSDPHRLAASGYDGFAALLRANMAHAGALRIDHAIGLARLFWVPDGGQGSDGAYVTYPCRDLLGEVALASADARCLVVGEDLGTVPEGFRDALAASDMLGYRAMLLERDGIGFRDPATYPPLSLACVTSHDLPTFAGWWRGVDFAERVEVGQMDEAGVGAALAGREEEKAALADALGDGATPAAEAEDLTARVHGWIASSPAALVMVQADDLALEQRSVNLPGTDTERPNWRRRLKPTLGELFGPGGARIAAAVRAARADPPLR